MSSAAVSQLNSPPPPQSMEVGDVATMRPRNAIKRDIPRFVVQVGDHLPDATKRNWKGVLGYQLGGQVFDLTEVPCLWKFSGWVTRGRLTPLIKKPTMAFQAEEIVKKKADQIAEIVNQTGEAQELKDVYRMSWPWDSLQTLLAEHNGRKGIVEVGVLEGVEWDLRIAQQIQLLIFPNWAEIEAGRAMLPFKVDDFASLVASRRSVSNDNVYQAVVDAYLESADKFKVYAEEIVRKTKDLARRGASDLGYVMGISPYSRHLAAQIGESIENQTVVVSGAGNQPARGMTAEEIDLRRREIEAHERANELKAIELGIKDEAEATPAAITQPASQSMESEAPAENVEFFQETPAAEPVAASEILDDDEFVDATVEDEPVSPKSKKK